MFRFIVITLLLGLVSVGVSSKNSNVLAATQSFHFGFRWNDRTDWTKTQQKWTKSAYVLNNQYISKGVDYYTIDAWGHSYRAGRTGNVDVSRGHSYRINRNRKVYLYNTLVESYGTGNNAFIHAVGSMFSNGQASGTWSADH